MSETEYNITELLDKLQSPDSLDREDAVYRLSGLQSDEAIAGLVIALDDSDASVREAATDCLAKVRGETTTMLLSEFLGAENIRTRNLSAEILVKIGSEAVPGLLGWIGHEHHDVRKFVVDVLGLIGDDRAVEGLCSALWDENINVCCSAAEALGVIGAPGATEALIAVAEKIADVRPQAIEAIGKIKDPRGIDTLIDYLTCEDPLLMFTAAEALGNIGSPKALKKLSNVINDDSVEIAGEAFKSALMISDSIRVDLKQHISGERLRKFLVDGFVNKEEHIINFALRSPDLWSDVGLIQELLSNVTKMETEILERLVSQVQRSNQTLYRIVLEMLLEADVESQKALLTVLKTCITPGSHSELDKLAKSDEEDVRMGVAVVLGNAGSVENVPTLQELAKDPVGHVRTEAFKAMGWIGSEIALPDLIKGLDDVYPDVREICVGAMVTLGSAEVITLFTEELAHGDPERQRLAAAALGWIGEDESVEPLSLALGHSSPAVRREALSALARMKHPMNYDELVVLMNDEDDIVQKVAITTLASMYPVKSISAISWFLQDGDMWLRFHAISVLSGIDHEDAVSALKTAAFSGSHETRVAAISALADRSSPEVQEFLANLDADGERDVAEALASATGASSGGV